MSQIGFVFATPVAQPEQTGLRIESLAIALSPDAATGYYVPVQGAAPYTPVPNVPPQPFSIALTAADMQSILAVIVARAGALGMTPPGSAFVI